jgi:ketosteroid isomerase-like protein
LSLEESNKAIFHRYLEFWRVGDLSRIDEIVSPTYVGHVSAGDRDQTGLVERIRAFRALFADIAFTIEDQIAADDKVITRMSARGTHQPTGTATTLIGINISRIAEQRIQEEWAVWERLVDSYQEYV